METLIDLSKAFGWLAAILVNLLIAWIVWERLRQVQHL